MKVEKIAWQNLLFDFYGELLTEHQRQVYGLYLDDLSISEIGEELGVTRQGAHDLIKRVNKILEGYEEKLLLVKKFMDAQSKVKEITKLTAEYKNTKKESLVDDIERISKEILDEF